MKKIYASILAFGVAFGATAQMAQQSAQLVKGITNSSTIALEQTVSTPSVFATGDTIGGLYYDFSVSANWTFGNEAGTTGSWVIGTDAPSGDFPIDVILSATAANGFALYDSDLLCGTDNAFVQMANPVDLSGEASVAIRFQQYYSKFQDQTFVEVSTDGTNWTSYEVNAAVAVNAATDNPDELEVNISGVAANQPQVWVRFRFMGACDYAWMIDDVVFVEGAASDLAMNDVWHGDIINAFEYQQIPLAQAREVVIGATCENRGAVAQTNAIYTFDISDGSSSVASGTFPANNVSMASTAYDTTWYDSGFTPSELGDYTVTVSVASDEVDEVPGNNEEISAFKMTNNIYAHDDEDNIEFILTGGDIDGTTTSNEFKVGVYYEMSAAANLTAVQVAFGRLTTTTACIVEVFESSDLSNALATTVYDILPSEVGSGGVSILVDILIEDGEGILLDADVIYLISIGNTGEGEELYIEASAGDADNGQLRYGPFGVGGSIDWYTGYTTSPTIRGNFDATISVEENEDVSGVTIYPNPTTDNLNINFVSKENQNVTINVIGVDGGLVFSENLTTKVGQASRTTVDFANLAKGIYMVQLVGANSSLTERVIVQ
jgi:hypothetical protein